MDQIKADDSRDQAPAFWLIPADRLLASLQTGSSGLSRQEAADRASRFGPNVFRTATPRSFLVKLGRRVLNPLVAILLVAAAISGFTGDFGSFVIIVCVIALSITLDLLQEHRAERAAEALRRSVAIKADVRRDEGLVATPVEELVPGDIVELRAGDVVPADGIVIGCQHAQVNESLMTGEPFPVTKSAEPCSSSAPAEATNALFAGTSVVGGSAVMLVVTTGPRTRFGGIAAALSATEAPTALEQGVQGLGLLILRLTVFLTLFVLLAHLAAGRPAVDSFLFAVALAVGLTPELLPMVMTVTLARGAQRMARRKVIVKRLSAIHDLGAMDVLCVDKTGTLTEARITLVDHVDAHGKRNDEVLSLAALNSRFSTGLRSPLDEAMLTASRDLQFEDWTRLAEIPFDFERRCISILARKAGKSTLVMKGAPEAVIARATTVLVGGVQQPIESMRDSLAALEADYAEHGFRLLAVATKPARDAQGGAGPKDETDMTIVGFCVFSDPPKADAANAIAALDGLGIGLKIVSGDHAAVVRHVAYSVGLPRQAVLTGSEIAELTDVALAARIKDIDLFARVGPDQKARIVKAVRASGHVVGFMGDGVNDAPAIHAAHVGLSVEGATDVARAAADMILLAPDLGVLGNGVREGRRTFANILKYVRMGTSSNFGNMLSMALASVVLPFLPLLPIQILLNNLLYDLSEIGIPFDNVDPDDLARPDAWDMKRILHFTIVMGTVSSLFDGATFALLIKAFHADAATFQTAWFAESITTQILVIFLIRSRSHVWSSRPNWILVTTSLGALAASVALIASPIGRLFGFVALTPQIGAALCAVLVVYLIAAQAAKHLALRPGCRHKQ